MFNEQCEDVYFKTECRNERCACKFEMVPEVTVDGAVICTCEFQFVFYAFNILKPRVFILAQDNSV